VAWWYFLVHIVIWKWTKELQLYFFNVLSELTDGSSGDRKQNDFRFGELRYIERK